VPLLRLLHLVSPTLPVGAFTYSQGIEWAVEAGWIRDSADLEDWLRDQLSHSLASLDLPLLARMHAAALAGDREAMEEWIEWMLAGRETAELRLEEANRGRALAELIGAWAISGAAEWKPILARSQAAGFAYAAALWKIPARDTLLGYTWGWLENLTLAGIKIVPLGQTAGQQLLGRLIDEIPAYVDAALRLGDEEIGANNPALAIASSRHESQYTRLFRS